MVITLKTINKVKFPVFRLPSCNWSEADGLLWLDQYGLLDDRNIDSPKLGLRRLKSPFNDRLCKLNKAIWDLNGVVKQYPLYFIDSNGRPFIYEKTKTCKLKYLRIKRLEKKISHCLLYVKGIPKPFTVPRPPLDDQQWAGIIHYYGFPWFLYEYSHEELKDTRRKV